MSKTARCPLCGKDPVWTYYPDQDSLKIACCKVSIESHDLWNQYAAAMELAKAEYAVRAEVDRLIAEAGGDK